MGGGIAKLLADVNPGPGMETIELSSFANGVADVWVHKSDGEYDRTEVDTHPASVNIFCHRCKFEGNVKTGLVTTLTQSFRDLPPDPSTWWNIGQFVAFNGVQHWQSCSGPSCYSSDQAGSPAGSAPPVPTDDSIILSFSASDTSGDAVSDVVYNVYKDYPAEYEGCTASCGTLVAVASSSSCCGYTAVVPGGVDYLVIASKPDFRDAYVTNPWQTSADVMFTDLTPTKASRLFVTQNPVTGDKVTGTTFKIYSNFSTNYHGCTTKCGTLIGTSTTGTAIDVDSKTDLLVVATIDNFYDTYTVVNYNRNGQFTVQLVPKMQPGQNRVVLEWFQRKDLDLWVINGDDYSQKSYYSNKGTAVQMGGGTVTLDKDITNYNVLEPGASTETTQFRNLSGGNIEVWVNHYTFSPKFTFDSVTATPAYLNVFCDLCTWNGRMYAGFVVSEKQNASDIVGTQKYWHPGHWTTVDGSVEWHT